jgi:cation diffusion facilitator family transporter
MSESTCSILNKGHDRTFLLRFAAVSIAAALVTIVLKSAAYFLTGSVGLLSDAFESLVNLAGALMTFGMLKISFRPPDEEHIHGHDKAEYFSSSVEGLLIIFAAAGIIYAAVKRIIEPIPLEELGTGLVISTAASLVNLAVGIVMIKYGKKNKSIAIEADGQHLLTDVWTSAGVIAGIFVVSLTGWNILDPVVALAVAVNIIWTGILLLRRSVSGLMDASVSKEDCAKIQAVMQRYRRKGFDFHALRTRQAASRIFISVHILVPGNLSVHDAHHLAEDFEKEISSIFGDVSVTTHLEPIDDEISMDDINLVR